MSILPVINWWNVAELNVSCVWGRRGSSPLNMQSGCLSICMSSAFDSCRNRLLRACCDSKHIDSYGEPFIIPSTHTPVFICVIARLKTLQQWLWQWETRFLWTGEAEWLRFWQKCAFNLTVVKLMYFDWHKKLILLLEKKKKSLCSCGLIDK